MLSSIRPAAIRKTEISFQSYTSILIIKAGSTLKYHQHDPTLSAVRKICHALLFRNGSSEKTEPDRDQDKPVGC